MKNTLSLLMILFQISTLAFGQNSPLSFPPEMAHQSSPTSNTDNSITLSPLDASHDYCRRQTEELRRIQSQRENVMDNGEEIIFTLGTSVWVQFADGTGRRELINVNSLGYSSISSADWSSEGTHFAFIARKSLTEQSIFIANSDGSNPILITHFNEPTLDVINIRELSFSPIDSDIIYTIGAVDGTFATSFFYVTNLNTLERDRVGDDNVGAVEYEYGMGNTRVAFEYIPLAAPSRLAVWDYEANTTENWGVAYSFEQTFMGVTWNNTNSLFCTYRDTDEDIHTIYRLDRQGDESIFTTIITSELIVSTPSLSPNRQQMYFSTIDDNNIVNMYLVELSNNGDYISQQTIGSGYEPDWRQNIPTITAPLTINISINNHVLCFGDNSGSATATVNGGTGEGYTYQWDNGTTNATATNLTAGTHSVTVMDSNGTSVIGNVTITEPAQLFANLQNNDNSCFAANDGTATATPSGGTAPYSYHWTLNGNGNTAANLPAGTYVVTVTDANNCQTTESVTIQQPNALIINASVLQAASCGADDGQATVNITGGTGNYTIQWDNNETGSTASQLSAGTHTVIVTDANACSEMATVTISQTDGPNAAAVVVSDITCHGDNNGAAMVNVTGGTGNYTYQWSNGSTSSTVSNLQAGTHSVEVTDAVGCSTSTTVEITEPTAIQINFTSNQSATCGAEDGALSISVSGGTGNYTYQWNNNENGTSINQIPAGNYTITVTDANNCQAVASATVNSEGDLSASASDIQSTNCFGESNGQATVTVTGANNPSFQWANGNTNATANDLSGGTHQVTVSDENGCEVILTVVIEEPDALILETSIVQEISCFGASNGVAFVEVDGGTPGYNYAWSNAQSTQNATGLDAGIHTVFISDNNGCSASESITLTEPDALILTTSTVAATNNEANGSASVEVTGGTPSYTYEWNTSPVQTTATATNLSSGIYAVIVTDANGCDAIQTAEVDNTTPVITPEFVQQFEVFPNPTQDMVYLSLELEKRLTVEIRLVDVLGRTLQKEFHTIKEQTLPMNLETLEAGVYWLTLLVEGEMISRKLIKT